MNVRMWNLLWSIHGSFENVYCYAVNNHIFKELQLIFTNERMNVYTEYLLMLLLLLVPHNNKSVFSLLYKLHPY